MTAIAGFSGSKNLADEVAQLIIARGRMKSSAASPRNP
jgi:hypothetical protein